MIDKRYYLKLVIVLAVLAVLTAIVFQFTLMPISWDELLYMNASQNNTAYPHVMNRYAHIYFQKLFISITGSTISGAQLYYSFLYSATLIMVFLTSNRLFDNKVITGFISVLFFLIQDQFLVKYIGITYADYTLMFLSTLFIFILVYNIERGFNKFFIYFLGFLFVLIIKSKETGIFLIFTFFAFHSYKNGVVKRAYTFLVAGIFSAFVFLSLLDWIFLDDPFFGIKITNISTLMKFNLGNFERFGLNPFHFLLNSSTWIPFFLYFVALIKIWKSLNLTTKILWCSPFTYIVILTLMTIFGRFEINERYLSPIIPLICILASQHLALLEKSYSTNGKSKNGIYRLLLLLLLAIPIVYFVVNIISEILSYYNWTPGLFQNLIVDPILITIIIFIIISNLKNILRLQILSISLVFIMGFRVTTNINNTAVKNKNSETRFTPLIIFKDSIQSIPVKKVYISRSINNPPIRMLGRDDGSNSWMLNVFFGFNLASEDVTFTEDISHLYQNLYDLVFLTKGEYDNSINWKEIRRIDSFYNFNESNDIVLLTKKSLNRITLLMESDFEDEIWIVYDEKNIYKRKIVQGEYREIVFDLPPKDDNYTYRIDFGYNHNLDIKIKEVRAIINGNEYSWKGKEINEHIACCNPYIKIIELNEDYLRLKTSTINNRLDPYFILNIPK